MIVGVDCYNMNTTGDVGRTIATASGGLEEHIPCVIVGVDCYHADFTGDVGMTMRTASGGLNEHIPCVMERRD